MEENEDTREWVLQRYLDDILTVFGHKFHLRVYILCVGALKVYVYDNILMLIAAHHYDKDNLDDIYSHLTNTARAVEDSLFEETKFIKLLDDLPSFLLGRKFKKNQVHIDSIEKANDVTEQIKHDIHDICGELFTAFENEYSVFCPMSNCFEIFGLDFVVDNDLGVSLLEVNPGPDFKQTGGKLSLVIENLWKGTLGLFLKEESEQQDFTLVYDKEWSVSKLTSGMSFI